MAGFKRRTLKELLKADINKLDAVTIQGYKKVARDEVARAIKKWEGKEYKSPAYYRFMEQTGGKGKISFSGKQTLNQQKAELARAINFLSNPSRTIRGWEKIKKSNLKKLNKALNKMNKTRGKKYFTMNDYDRLFSAYRKAKEMNPAVGFKEFRYLVMQTLSEKVKDESISIDELAIKMADELTEVYEQKEAAHQRAEENRSERFYRK